MPCRDPEATDRDLRTREVAGLIEYVHNKIGIGVSEEISFCSSAKGYDVLHLDEKYSLDNFTSHLCILLKSLRSEMFDDIVYNGKDKMSRRLADWWDDHKAKDRKIIMETQTNPDMIKSMEQKIQELQEFIQDGDDDK